MAVLTEARVIDLLRSRFTKTGNGGSGEYAFLEQVRNAAGFDARRTFDAVAVSLWPSRGLTIHVFEVKVSRSDWKRELAKPEKAEDACLVADRFSIVAPAGVVHDGELPPAWGLIEVLGDGEDKPWKLRERHPAPLLTQRGNDPAPIDRGFMVGMLRSVPGAVPGGRRRAPGEEELQAAEARGFQRGHDAGFAAAERNAQIGKDQDRSLAAEARQLRAALREAGVPAHLTTPSGMLRHVDQVTAALSSVASTLRLRSLRAQLLSVVEEIDGHLSSSRCLVVS